MSDPLIKPTCFVVSKKIAITANCLETGKKHPCQITQDEVHLNTFTIQVKGKDNGLIVQPSKRLKKAEMNSNQMYV